MQHCLFIVAIVLSITTLGIRADLLDCSDTKSLSIADFPVIGPKVASTEDTSPDVKHQVQNFVKKVGCQIKKTAGIVKDQAKQLGQNLKEGAKKLSAKAKDLSADVKVKINELQEKFSHDTSDERRSEDINKYVELINPDILKAEQQCGHGHILDALGNCSKLRK